MLRLKTLSEVVEVALLLLLEVEFEFVDRKMRVLPLLVVRLLPVLRQYILWEAQQFFLMYLCLQYWYAKLLKNVLQDILPAIFEIRSSHFWVPWNKVKLNMLSIDEISPENRKENIQSFFKSNTYLHPLRYSYSRLRLLFHNLHSFSPFLPVLILVCGHQDCFPPLCRLLQGLQDYWVRT